MPLYFIHVHQKKTPIGPHSDFSTIIFMSFKRIKRCYYGNNVETPIVQIFPYKNNIPNIYLEKDKKKKKGKIIEIKD